MGFENNKYVKISNALPEQVSFMMFEYIKLVANRYDVIKEKLPDLYHPAIHGHKSVLNGGVKDLLDAANIDTNTYFNIISNVVSGGDVSGAYSKYGDTLTDTLLLTMQKDVEKYTGLELVPTYSFFRMYSEGDVLIKHIDRPSCEISCTICAGYEGEQWPIYMNGTPIYQDQGDVAIYRGGEVKHWREAFKGKVQAQIFLHYNDKNGPYGESNLYDGRHFLGLPSISS